MITHPDPQPADPRASAPRTKSYGKWRAATLTMVYVLMGVHIAHWKIAGQTLAPLELHEVMYTLELGVITAGFLFMVVAALSVLVFGRFFCSWGCHILALQDLCAWLLGKVGIRPRPIRSRALLLVPVGALLYMFGWPQVARVLGNVWPSTQRFVGVPKEFEWRVLSDAQGWASFATTDFWRNLPGPGITALTFLVCGFAIVYVLGSRSFCTYGCPYGVLFGLADRVAPGRIVLKGECTKCGLCTAECQTHIRVHEEIAKFGNVVSPGCLKDLDCVTACPTGGLSFGFTKPPWFRSLFSKDRPRVRYDFSLAEELLMVGVFLGTVFVFRGLYSLVPFLMTLGLGGILAFVTVLTLRLFRRSNVFFHRHRLKTSGRFTNRGRAWAAVALLLAVFTAHSAYIRYHEHEGERAFARIRNRTAAEAGALSQMCENAFSHLRAQERWGLVRAPDLDRGFASLTVFMGRNEEAEVYLRRILERQPNDRQSLAQLAAVLAAQGKTAEARDARRRAASAVAGGTH